MKKLLALFLLAVFGFCATIQNQIAYKKDSLKSTKKLEDQLNKKLEDLAGEIVKGEEDIAKTAILIDELSNQVFELENSAKIASSELSKLTTKNTELIQSKNNMQKRLIKIISDDFAYDLIAPSGYEDSQESIIANEVIKNLNSLMDNEFKKIATNYENTMNLIKNQSDKINVIKVDLKEFKLKEARLKKLQSDQQTNLANLKQDKEVYQNQLKKLQAQQNELRKTLEELQIVVKKQKQSTQAEVKHAQNIDIKQFGSSYKASSVKKYTGPKTIAPLDGFSVKQKFGDFIDPIYNIKIFNESVVLRANEPDARVKSVLPGTVVFAKDTPILDRVVIVENPNGIHTIYAHLDKIAPTIKVGSKVKKGYVIGRVKRDLTFEVTQKNYHINPLDLILKN